VTPRKGIVVTRFHSAAWQPALPMLAAVPNALHASFKVQYQRRGHHAACTPQRCFPAQIAARAHMPERN